MLDMGWAEIGVLFVLALLIFGPDKLPKFASDAAGMIRKLRQLAQNAQSGLTEQGIDVDGIKNDLQSVAELHPKKIMGSVVSDFQSATVPIAAAATTSSSEEPPSDTSSQPDVKSAAKSTSDAQNGNSSTPAAESAQTPSAPSVKKVLKSNTKFDPDAT